MQQLDRFFTIALPVNPQPFDFCFSDEAHNQRENINFMLNFNGIKAANWVSITRDVSRHMSRSTLHVFPSSSSF
jgi:hypothetical protein